METWKYHRGVGDYRALYSVLLFQHNVFFFHRHGQFHIFPLIVQSVVGSMTNRVSQGVRLVGTRSRLAHVCVSNVPVACMVLKSVVRTPRVPGHGRELKWSAVFEPRTYLG